MSLTVNSLKVLDMVNGDGQESIPFDRTSRRSSVMSTCTASKSRRASMAGRRDSKWSLVSSHLALNGGGGLQSPNRALSTKPWKQNTNVKKETTPPAPKIANTYKMKPDSECNFRPEFIEREVQKILDTFFKSQPYDPLNAGYMTTSLSELVKTKVKDLGFKRHKLIVQVFVGSKDNQSMEVASRCVWDSSTDNFVTVSWQNGSIFAIANVYGVYYE